MVNEKFNILRFLIENQEKVFSIREIAKQRKVNYKSAYLAIHDLNKRGIINLNKVGNTTNCSFNKKFDSLVFDVEFFRRKELIKNKNFKIIYERLEEFNFPLIALVFGSFAKGKVSKNSDIDFLVISENAKEVKRIFSLIPLNVHLTVFSYEEFVQMLKSKEFSVVSEAIKKNVILIGIEEYYRFLGGIK